MTRRPRYPVVCKAYTTQVEIVARLEVLYAKAQRVVVYDESAVAGRPDLQLLDLKQQAIMARYKIEPGRLLPYFVKRTLLRTIDVLETKRRSLEAAAA